MYGGRTHDLQVGVTVVRGLALQSKFIKILLLGLLGAVGIAAFLVTQVVQGGWAGDNGAPPGALKQGLEKVIEDEAKPPFIGDKLGIFISGTTSAVPVPPQYTTPEDICAPGVPQTLAPWEQAGELAHSIAMPPEYGFLPADPDSGPVACGGNVYVAKRAYDRAGGGHVVVGRTRLNVVSGMHWPSDRVKVVTLGGRQAVLLEPIFSAPQEESGPAGTSTQLLFPEPFGMTFVFATGSNLADVLTLGATVGEATR